MVKEQSFLRLYLLLVVGRVREEGRHMEHDLVILVRCVQGVCARGVRCRRKKPSITIVWQRHPEPNETMVKCGAVLLLIAVLLSADPV